MRSNSLTPILWESVTQAGFLAGLIATVGHFIGLRGFPFAALYILLLVILSITIYNTRTYLRRPSMQFIDGHDKVFDSLLPMLGTPKIVFGSLDLVKVV